jgi:putative nucleotidyltransferase with HDIG domain
VRKRIDVHSLRLGMYVAELDRPWLGTPFLFQGFEIRSQEEIDELRRYCKSVYIDIPESGQTTPSLKRTPATERPASPIQTEAEQRTARDFLKIINEPRGAPVYKDQTTLEQELEIVRDNYQHARVLVHEMLEDAMLGKSLNSAAAKQVVAALTESVLRNPDALTCFSQLKLKDEYTALHCLRVCVLALSFGRHLGLDEETLLHLGTGALLHDVGKARVPTEILNKPGELSDEEFELMRSHVPLGVDILNQTSGISDKSIEVARNHHERYSGGGYHQGLQGDTIGFFGMIGGIVDCYDAVTSDRAYREGMAAHTALKKMYEWRGRDFHPRLVEQFIQCMGIYPIGSVVELNTGEVAVVIGMNRIRHLKPRVALVLKADCTPYAVPVYLDLVQHRTNDGQPCDIERVLEPGAFGINPVRYLPIHGVRI